MIPEIETLSTTAQFVAASQSEEPTANAARLEAWKRRYPRDLVPVPDPVTPGAGWPETCRTAKGYVLKQPNATTVTQLKARPRP